MVNGDKVKYLVIGKEENKKQTGELEGKAIVPPHGFVKDWPLSLN
jgi:hypothetical protein